MTVNVPSRSSAGSSVPLRAASASLRHLRCQFLQRGCVAATDDRDDQPLLGLNGDTDVVALQIDDLVSFEAGVQLRELLQRSRGRLQHLRDELGEIEAGEVALLDERHRRHLAVRPRQVLDDLAPHPAHRLAPALGNFVFL